MLSASCLDLGLLRNHRGAAARKLPWLRKIAKGRGHGQERRRASGVSPMITAIYDNRDPSGNLCPPLATTGIITFPGDLRKSAKTVSSRQSFEVKIRRA